jgi:hypothetical protein
MDLGAWHSLRFCFVQSFLESSISQIRINLLLAFAASNRLSLPRYMQYFPHRGASYSLSSTSTWLENTPSAY